MPKSWDVPSLNKGQGWVPSNRLLLFQFYNRPGKVALVLYIGPGNGDSRQKLFDMASANTNVFKASGSLYPKWKSIFTRKFLTKKDLEEEEFQVLVEKIKKQWDRFLSEDFPSILEAMKGQSWIWE